MSGEEIAALIRAHIPRDRYDDDGESIGTYCTCGEWEGDYFADGEAGPFDVHLAEVLLALFEQAKQEGAAEAWDAGYMSGWEDRDADEESPLPAGGQHDTPNPYRAERAAQTPQDEGRGGEG